MVTQTVGNLRVDLKADIADFRREMKSSAKVFKKNTDQMKKQATNWQTSMKKAAAGVGTAFAAIGVAGLVRDLIKLNSQFAVMRATLETVLGSASKAATQFDKLKEFAKTTPFALQQSVEAFTKLKLLGLDPSERSLRSFGNTAAAMGKSLTQFIEAVADASTMEFERLKEFGIKARQQTETVTFTFQGVKTVVKKEAAEIAEFLTQLGEVQFAGAMDKQMDSITGALSNLQDSFANLGDAIGEGGFADTVEFLANKFAFLNNKIAEAIKLTATYMEIARENSFTSLDALSPFFAIAGAGLSKKGQDFKDDINNLLIRFGLIDKPKPGDPGFIGPSQFIGPKFEPTLGELVGRIEAGADDLIPTSAKGNLKFGKHMAALELPGGGEPPGREIAKIAEAAEEMTEAVKLTRFELENMMLATRDWKNGAIVAFAQYADAATDAANNTRMAFSRTFNSLEDQLTDFLSTGKFNFRQFVDGIVRDMNRIFVRQNITGPLASMLGQSSLFGGSISSDLFNFGGAFAHGGRPPVGRVALIGEQGPELFVPDTAGRIIPNGGGGGMTINFGDIIIQGGADEDTGRRSAAQVQEELALAMREAQRSM